MCLLKAREAREAFIEKKRQEVMECIGGTDLTEEDVNNMEDDELIEFDEETKAEYEALPTPESFNKTEVNDMIDKIKEETAFGTDGEFLCFDSHYDFTIILIIILRSKSTFDH